jgi:23S rRNA A2030 N6-methylase RlmJ
MQMVDREALAQQLIDFIEAVRKAEVSQPVVQDYPGAIAKPKLSSKLRVAQRCVDSLSDEDRAHLHHIMEAMTRACH